MMFKKIGKLLQEIRAGGEEVFYRKINSGKLKIIEYFQSKKFHLHETYYHILTKFIPISVKDHMLTNAEAHFVMKIILGRHALLDNLVGVPPQNVDNRPAFSIEADESASKSQGFENCLKQVKYLREKALESLFLGKIGEYETYKIAEADAFRELPTIWSRLTSLKVINDEWTYAIGHLGILAIFVEAKLLGLTEGHHVVITSEDRIANRCFLDYLGRFLDIHVFPHSEYVLLSRVFSPCVENISVWHARKTDDLPSRLIPKVKSLWEESKRPPLLDLTPSHRIRGERCLQDFGIDPGQWFVAFHVRGEGRPPVSGLDSGRDSVIDSYRQGIQYILEAGGRGIRLGHGSMRHVNLRGIEPRDNWFEYASSGLKSDWMDVYLLASARFFVGTQSGPIEIPYFFGVATLYTNATTLCMTLRFFPEAIFIPKLWFSYSLGRLLTFREILTSNAGWLHSSESPEGDLQLVDNSEDDILEGISFMMEATSRGVDGFKKFVKGKSDLQSRFDEICRDVGIQKPPVVSPAFLRKHQNLLI
jgi:putative glycosyltransferase (TIGR04372 family)